MDRFFTLLRCNSFGVKYDIKYNDKWSNSETNVNRKAIRIVNFFEIMLSYY